MPGGRVRTALAMGALLTSLLAPPLVASADDYGAFPRPKVAPVSSAGAGPTVKAQQGMLADQSGNAVVLSRTNRTVTFNLDNGASASFLVAYRSVNREGPGNLAPWLLSGTITNPVLSPYAFTLQAVDQTGSDAPSVGSTRGNVTTSSRAQFADNLPDIAGVNDVSNIQDLFLTAASEGNFLVTATNNTGGAAKVTITLYPMTGGKVDPL